MKRLIRTLQFFRLVDHNEELSLTNITLMGTMVYLTVAPDLQVQHLLTLVATLTAYQLKRFALKAPLKSDADLEKLQEAVASLESKVVALQMQGSMRNPRA